MRTAATIILKQLANEGVRHDDYFGLHSVVIGPKSLSYFLATEVTLEEAVKEALKHTIRIAALLAKLDDALSPDRIAK